MTTRYDKGKQKASDLSYVVISGGTGANPIVSAFGHAPAFVLPVSDDGGSSAEILRCFGGPSIGDIRSRLTRLISVADDPGTRDEFERTAIHTLMSFRFPATAPEKEVRDLWTEVVEGRSELWAGIGEDKKECIRAFLVHFQTLCLRRAHKRFSFRNFSLGNGFLTGARDLFGSLPSAIFLFKSIAGVGEGVKVVPVINTNQIVTIAAQLEDDSTLVGQCNISHPAPSSQQPNENGNTLSSSPLRPSTPYAPLPKRLLPHSHNRRDSLTFDTNTDTDLAPAPPSRLLAPASAPASGSDALQIILNSPSPSTPPSLPIPIPNALPDSNLSYVKSSTSHTPPLPSRIQRIYYINLYQQEIFPSPNAEVLDLLRGRDVLVYSCGSLWTSVVPCLALRGMGAGIASSRTLKAKVLLLNSRNDRETEGYKASDYLKTIVDTLRYYDRALDSVQASRLVSHVVCLEGGTVELDEEDINAMGVRIVRVPEDRHPNSADKGVRMFTPDNVEWAMERVMEDL